MGDHAREETTTLSMAQTGIQRMREELQPCVKKSSQKSDFQTQYASPLEHLVAQPPLLAHSRVRYKLAMRRLNWQRPRSCDQSSKEYEATQKHARVGASAAVCAGGSSS
jgi:hypothetical protein